MASPRPRKGLLPGCLGGQGRSVESRIFLLQAQWEVGPLATAAWCGYMAWVCTQLHIPGYVWDLRGDTAQDTDTQSSRQQCRRQGRAQGDGWGRMPQQGHTQATWEQ